MTAIEETAALDQADRRIDHRDQRLAPALAAAAGAKPLDIVGAVMPLAAARHRHRAQQSAADIGVERVEFDAEPGGGLARPQQLRSRSL